MNDLRQRGLAVPSKPQFAVDAGQVRLEQFGIRLIVIRNENSR